MAVSRKGKKVAKKAVKKGLSSRRTTRKVSSRALRNSTIIEVDHPSKVRAFESALKKGMSIVLIYAEWCGACHRFRDNIWSKVCSKDKNAAMNRLSVRDDMVANTSLAGAKYDYLPAILAVGPDGKPAPFTTPEGKMSNAMPTPQTEQEMTQVLNATPSGNEVEEEGGEEEASEESLYEPLTMEEEPLSMSTNSRPNTPYPQASLPVSNNNANNTRVNNAKNSRVYSPIPQSLPEEAIDTAVRSSAVKEDQIPVTSLRTQAGGGCGCGLQRGGGCGCGMRKQSGGGNLFQTLVAISRGALPAAALAATAVYMTRRQRRSHKKAGARGKTQKKGRGRK
jgi:hypothetical protein